MQTPSNNSKIPRFVNHGSTSSKQQDLPPSKMPVPTKRRFDDVPRLDIPLSPDTGDEAHANTESTTTSTVLSPSQSGDGSLVTVDSWKSGNWTSGGNCLCRKSKSAPFSPKELKGGAGNIIVVDMTQTEGNAELAEESLRKNDQMMQIDADVDELTVRLDFTMNKRSSASFVKCEMDNETVDEENETEEINVSLKPMSLKGTESEITEECTSLKGTESFTYDSELSNQMHSPQSAEKVAWPVFNNNNNNNTNGSNSSIDTNKLSIKYQSDLHARIKSMIDFGKSLLSSRNSDQDHERSSCTTISSTFSSRGKCESESQLSTIKLMKKMEQTDNKNNRRWTPKRKLENMQKLQEKMGSKLSSPQLCLLNCTKFSSPTSSEVWYDTNDDSCCVNKGLSNNEDEIESDPTPSETAVTTTDSDSAIMLSSVGVQVDLIEWDRMRKELPEVRDIGVQVSKKAKKEWNGQAKGDMPAIKRPTKKRTVYFDLSTPKQTGSKLDSPNIFYDVKECESDRDSEQDRLSDFQTLSTVTSQDIIKSPYTDTNTKVSIVVKEDGSIISKKLSMSDADSCNDDVTKSDRDACLSKTHSEDTYTIDLSKQWSTSTMVKSSQAIPVAITSLTCDSKARWLKDVKGRVVANASTPLATPTKIPSATKLARDSVKKASTSLTQVNSKQCGVKKFQSPHQGERIKSMDEVRKVNDFKGIQRYRGISEAQMKKM